MIIKISALIYTLIAITVITLMIMRPPIKMDIATNQNTPSEATVQNPTVIEASDIQATENSNNTIPDELPATAIPPMPISVTPETAVSPAMPITPTAPATEAVEVPIPSAVAPVDSSTAINPSPVIPSIPIAPSAPDTAPQAAVPANVIDTPLNSVLPENTTLN